VICKEEFVSPHAHRVCSDTHEIESVDPSVDTDRRIKTAASTISLQALPIINAKWRTLSTGMFLNSYWREKRGSRTEQARAPKGVPPP